MNPFYAKKIANYLSTDHHELILSIDEMLNKYLKYQKFMMNPLEIPHVYLH